MHYVPNINLPPVCLRCGQNTQVQPETQIRPPQKIICNKYTELYRIDFAYQLDFIQIKIWFDANWNEF